MDHETALLRPHSESRWSRVFLAAVSLVAVLGLTLGWDKGRLPVREPAVSQPAADLDIAPDLALYRDLTKAVRDGRDYYAAARQTIPAYGFPIASPLNWRLPTYAWVFSRLPGNWAIQTALLVLSAVALVLAWRALARRHGDLAA